VAAEPAPRSIVERARAKLNLDLHIVGRRADGYHELESLVVFADAGDVITVSPAAHLRLDVTGEFAADVPVDARNLVWHAAEQFAAVMGCRADVAISLEKILPVASGIGGGSADAAATLRSLAALWAVDQGDARLAQVAASLGADVPACLALRPCLMSGIGERLHTNIAVPELGVVLANPRIPLHTPEVFARRVGAFSRHASFSDKSYDAREFAALLRDRRNDLTPAAVSLVPAIAAIIAAMEALPDCLLARMSGSGATAFGLFADARMAALRARELAASRPEWWIIASTIGTACDDGEGRRSATAPGRT
jgi:4-diphosphocytidyl-2-C-methyl-D-erythritol kinase